MKTDKRKTFESIDEELASTIAAGLQPAEPGLGERSRLRERILERVLDPAPEGTFTLRATDPGWVALNDLVQVRTLRQNTVRGEQTMLIRMLPGGAIDAHSHACEEECYVIDGEVEVGSHHLRRGDMHVASSGTRHQCIRSRIGALLLVRAGIEAEVASHA